MPTELNIGFIQHMDKRIDCSWIIDCRKRICHSRTKERRFILIYQSLNQWFNCCLANFAESLHSVKNVIW